MDEKPTDDNDFSHWTIFYSIYINTNVFEKIHKRATLLLKTSATLSHWHESKYGKVLRIMDVISLAKIREFWTKYAAFAELPAKTLETRSNQFMKEFRAIHKSLNAQFMSGIRAVGPTFLNADVLPFVADAFDKFWATGVIGGLKELVTGAKYVNPLFVYSNIGIDQCIIHYGTDPVLGFHCDTTVNNGVTSGIYFVKLASILMT
jgi:hypothetical protein